MRNAWERERERERSEKEREREKGKPVDEENDATVWKIRAKKRGVVARYISAHARQRLAKRLRAH